LPKIVLEVRFPTPPSAENSMRHRGTKNALQKILRRTKSMAEIKLRRLLARIAIATGMTTGIISAQSLLDQVNFRSASVGGLRVYGVSVFSGYSTSAIPVGFGQSVQSLQDIGGSSNYGASATLGWQHHREKTSLSIMYSLTYSGVTRYSELNAFGHSLSIAASRQLGGKWTVTLAGGAEDSTQAQFLNQPSALSVISQLPVTIDDLAAAFSIGQFSNSQVASMFTGFTGAGMAESPARTLLLGNRVLSYSASARLNYAYSSRLSFHFGAFSTAGQSQRGGQNGVPVQEYVLPRSTGINGGMGMTYSLSPRTQIGFSVDESRSINRYQNGNTTNAYATFGRKMGMRWFMGLHGGGSFSQTTQTSYGTPIPAQVSWGGSLGVQTYSQTLTVSYDRSGSDPYGFAVGTNTSATGSWSWRRPGSRWSLSAGGGQHQIRNAAFVSISGWEASGGVSLSLAEHASLSAQYVYFNSAGNYAGTALNTAVQSVRVSLGWAPQVVPQRQQTTK
jgi:hypothetical protein